MGRGRAKLLRLRIEHSNSATEQTLDVADDFPEDRRT